MQTGLNISFFALWLICVIVSGGLTAICAIMYFRRKYKMAIIDHASGTEVPPSNDSAKSLKDIGEFLTRRQWAYSLCESSAYLIKYSEPLRRFIRLAHALGCEVIVRQVDDNRPDGDDDKEQRTTMRKEWYAVDKKKEKPIPWDMSKEREMEELYKQDGIIDTLRKAGKLE